MADKPLRVHGTPQPKGTSWLNEVKLDAARNTVEQLRQQAENREFEAAKARGITVEELVSKGQDDLKKVDPQFAEELEVEAERRQSTEAPATLARQDEVKEEVKPTGKAEDKTSKKGNK